MEEQEPDQNPTSQIQLQIPMDLNDTFGELNPTTLLNLDSTPCAAVNGGGGEEPVIGMEFESDEAAKEFYTAYAVKVGFTVRMNKSRRSRKDDSVIMRRFVCTKEGFHSKKVVYDDGKKKRKRGTAREGCMAMIEVVKKDENDVCKWVVTKLVTDHTHLLPGLQSQDSQATNGGNNGMNCNNNYNNTSIITRPNRVNPFGEGGEAQALLEYLKLKQSQNPSFFYAIQVDNNNSMTNLFWADSKSRLSYPNFRDYITFDTTYKKTKYMMPFACFKGINHHFQKINFGCCLLMDESKGSYIWLFETFLTCMNGSYPLLLITDKDKAMESAISRVFPNTIHRFCQNNILSRCKHKLCDIYVQYPTLKADLKACVNGSDSIEEFNTRWEYLLQKYNLWENVWLQSLYEMKEKWANVCQKGFFFPNLFISQRHESLNKFFKRNFNAKTSILVFIECFDQDLASQREIESQSDFETMHIKFVLKSPSLIEKRASEIYTKKVFDEFQEEFVQSLGYFLERENESENENDGVIIEKYILRREGEEIQGDNHQQEFHMVTITKPNNTANCTCGKFEYSGILCRHILRVFFTIGIRTLPNEYILERWTKNSAFSFTSINERNKVLEQENQEEQEMVGWYDDLCREGVKLGIEGGISHEVYKIAKNAIKKVFCEVINERNKQNNMVRVVRLQKNVKLPLQKLQPKKGLMKVVGQVEDGGQESSRV